MSNNLKCFRPLFIGAVLSSCKRQLGLVRVSLFPSPLHRGRPFLKTRKGDQ